MTDGKKLIIFICTGNTCRSPMAEALFKAMLSDEDKNETCVLSRGLSVLPGEKASEHSIEVMLRFGIDLRSHSATPLSEKELAGADLFVCMTEQHALMLEFYGVPEERIYVMNVPDPYGGELSDYRECAEKIKAQLGNIYELIKQGI